MCACVRACLCQCECMRVCMRVCVCMACNLVYKRLSGDCVSYTVYV